MATPGAGTTRPVEGEYAPYYGRYISLVPDGDIVGTLEQQFESTLTLLRGIDESRANHRYAPDKWSIKELVGHLIDAERIFAYRALCFARKDNTPIAGFEQDDYVAVADFDKRTFTDLISEFEYVRKSNVLLFRSFDPEALSSRGTASDSEISVRALLYSIAGHELHHMQVLKSRYV